MICFYNPHVDDILAEPPHFRLLKRRPLKKYGYMISNALADDGAVHVCADATISAFLPEDLFGRLPRFLRRIITRAEIRSWEKVNGLAGKTVVGETCPDDRVLFGFTYKASTGPLATRRPALSGARGLVLHLSHYFIATEEKSGNLQTLPQAVLAGDVDVTRNSYFQKYFAWYRRPLLVLPFAVQARFQVRKAFAEREPKVIATGTYHSLAEERPVRKYTDYMSYYQTDTYHPVRKLIAAHQKELKPWLDSRISLFRPPARGLARLKAMFQVSQKSYFNIDIVDLYNSYRYALVGEEASGFPAIGAFEAMACGCVLIGQPAYYAGLPMEEGVHFVGYDGTLQALRDTVDRLNADPKLAAAIAENGRRFVDQHLRQEPAWSEIRKAFAAILAG